MIAILKLILPIFLLIAVGAILRAAKIADETWVEVLNRYGLYIGFPSLIFLNLVGLTPEHLLEKGSVFLVNAGMIVFIMLAGLGISVLFRLPRQIANTLMVAAFYGNVAYLGYPVVTSVYPEKGPETTIIISIYTIILFSLGIFILELRRHKRESWWKIVCGILCNPFIVAIILGMLFLLFGWSVPGPIYSALEMIAGAASPVVLVSLGVFLMRKIPLAAIWRPALLISAVRLFAVPALFFLVASRLGSLEQYQATVLEAAMPLAITPFALSSMYPLDRSLTVSVIFLTSIASLVTLPLWVVWLGG